MQYAIHFPSLHTTRVWPFIPAAGGKARNVHLFHAAVLPAWSRSFSSFAHFLFAPSFQLLFQLSICDVSSFLVVAALFSSRDSSTQRPCFFFCLTSLLERMVFSSCIGFLHRLLPLLPSLCTIPSSFCNLIQFDIVVSIPYSTALWHVICVCLPSQRFAAASHATGTLGIDVFRTHIPNIAWRLFRQAYFADAIQQTEPRLLYCN